MGLEALVTALRGGAQVEGTDIMSDSLAYAAYRDAAMQAGNQPLSKEQWVAAGRPSG
jgi:hypothetical protein